MELQRIVGCKRLPKARQNPTRAGLSNRVAPLGRFYGYSNFFGCLSVGPKDHETF